ncbi:MAG: hypothetical protein WCC45_09185 [Paeniglutamicibacter sp.]
MSRSFAGSDAEYVRHRGPAKRFDPRIQQMAIRKLRQLDAATTLDTLRVPPGNHLETLKSG